MRWATEGGGGVGGGLGGVDDGEGVVEGGEGAADGGFEEWVVGAAEEEGLGVGGFGQGFCAGRFSGLRRSRGD